MDPRCNRYNTLNLTNVFHAHAYASYGTGGGWVNDFFPLILSVGLVTNLSFLFVIARVPRMRTTPNLYLALQTMADIIFLLTSTIPLFINYIFKDPRSTKMTTSFGCYSFNALRSSCYYVSLVSVTLVSFDRFVAVVYPLKFRLFRSKRNTAISVIVLLLIAGVSALFTSLDYAVNTTVCMIWPPETEQFAHMPTIRFRCSRYHPLTKLWNTIFNIIVFTIALSCNIGFYSGIIYKLSSRSVATQHSSNTEVNKTRNQIAKLVICNGIIFLLCQMPTRAIIIIQLLRSMSLIPKLPRNVFMYLNMLRAAVLVNSSVNALIYPVLSPFYRVAYIEAFCKFREKCQRGKAKGEASVTSNAIKTDGATLNSHM